MAADIDKYYLALGKFINEYAHVEADLFMLLVFSARVEHMTGKAIFSGTRTDGAISFIKRIHEARGTKVPASLADAFAQLNTITTARDHILHFGIYEDEESMISSNSIRAHANRTYKELDASPSTLDSMAHDLKTIGQILFLHQVKAADPKAQDPELAIAHLKLPGPWRYKSGAQGTQGPPTPKTTRKQKAQPPASPE